mgnify:CR=1 FL=1
MFENETLAELQARLLQAKADLAEQEAHAVFNQPGKYDGHHSRLADSYRAHIAEIEAAIEGLSDKV